MSTLEDCVRELIKRNYHSIPRFAHATGLSAQTIYSALRGGLATASASTVVPIAQALGLDPMQIINGRIAIQHNPIVNVPLIDKAPTELSKDSPEASKSFPIPVQLYRKFPQAFFLKVSGESMNRILPNGCFALVNPCQEAWSRESPYAVAIGPNQATVRRVRMLSAGIELLPDSNDPTFRSQVFDFNEPETPEIRILGRVVWYTLPYDWHFNIIS